MYTQCPDCGIAFRVTAVVLKQAAGKVRCGGCGNAFNALAYLSETKPDPSTRTQPDESLPELQPDSVETSSPSPTRSISPEQSAALLKTLDQLAGDDIRIEDTGVEWRVMSEDEGDEPGLDKIFERTPTQVDQFLTRTPTEVEAPEIFEDDEPSIVESVEVFERGDEPAQQTSAEELRFDDNTGLPEDFDFDEASHSAAPAAEPKPAPVAEPVVEAQQVDLALGDPDEWGDLLDEVVPAATGDDDVPELVVNEDVSETADSDSGEEIELTAEPADSEDDELDISAELAIAIEHEPDAEAILIEADADDELVAADADTPPDIDTQFGLQAEAMGIDLSGLHEKREIAEDAVGTAAYDIELLDDEDDDATRAMVDDDDVDELEDDDSLVEAVLSNRDLEDIEAGHDFPDSTGALEFELARAQSAAEQLEADSDTLGDEDDEPTSIDEDLLAAAFENEQAGNADDAVAEDDADDIPDLPDDIELELDEDAVGDELIADIDGKFDENIESLEIRLDDEDQDDDADAELVAAADQSAAHVVPPMSEEEQTINLQIDQDLLALAVEDEDGFASTIVIEDKKRIEDELLSGDGAENDDGSSIRERRALDKLKDTGSGFETIIMEGEFVRSAVDDEAEGDDAETGSKPKPAFVLPPEQPEEKGSSGRAKYGMVAGVLVLVLLLAAQLVHQSRATLATYPAINSFIAPIYRAVGAPITPDWDVSGWRFEVSTGSTNALRALADVVPDAAASGDDTLPDDAQPDDTLLDETPLIDAPENETLTIYSRIGNQSGGPLPYPLITVALVDRFEETLGAKTLEPGDYLTGDFDPRVPVPAGETFNAVISIESPSPDATGFTLHVCYRQGDGTLKCKMEDFRR